jgi:predicted transcriptional regulator
MNSTAHHTITQTHIISLIDGRKRKSIKRHAAKHGYTPEQYRDAFGLPANYPMTHPSEMQARNKMARAQHKRAWF